MSSKSKRLGSLADIYQSQKLDGSITKLRIDQIKPSTEQPRQERLIGVEELSKSIAKDGLLLPILVTKESTHYRIIAGERRFHAASKLNWESIECKIISREEKDYWRIAIIENLQRENLSGEEEATALMKLKVQDNLNDEELAKLIGKSRNYITEILSINLLRPDILDFCKKYKITQRNMLIQVTQAYKKNIINQFMKEYEVGKIKTVRDARNFNQGKKTQSIDPTITSKETNKNKAFVTELKIEKNEITITCSNEKEAQKLHKKLKKLL